MKRNLIKILALVLTLSMLVPMSAFAASGKVYDVYVSITDENSETDSGKKTNTKLEENLTLISGDEKMALVLEQAVLAHYTDGNKSTDMYLFQSPEMKRQMDEGLAIIAAGGDVKVAWAAYGTKYDDTWFCPYEVGLKAKLANFDTTVYDVGPGTHIVRHYNKWADDAKFTVTYTVTIIIAEHSTGGGGGSVTPAKPTVEVKDNTPSAIDPTTGEPIPSDIPVGGGTTTVENPNAKPGEEVRVSTKSDKGSMVNYISVKDENGNRIPVTYDGKGKFTFEMPESGNVTIEANYRVIPADPKETGVAELLNTDDHILYMIGDDKGDFRPNASISRAEVATAFFRLLRDQNVAVTQHFDDVSAKNWYVQPVETLASLHIIEGVGNGTFEPNRAITRAEFAAIAARFANALTAGTSFADVDEDAWYAVFVSTAASFGWINGVGNGMYEPNRPITRTEAAAIINRMLLRISDWIEVDAGAGRQFPDVGENFWGRYEISEAVNGHDHTLEEEYFHEDWLAEDWREAVDNDPVNFGQKH